MKKIIGFSIGIIILGATTYMILRIPGTNSSNATASEIISTEGTTEQWLGTYLQGKRVGYSFTKIVRAEDGLVVENRSQLSFIFMQELRSLTTHLFAHTDKDYTLKDFSLKLITADHPAQIEGRVENNKMILTLYSQGSEQTQEIVLAEKPYFHDALEEVIKKKGLKTGDEIKLPYFDPTTQTSTTATIKILDREEVDVLGERRQGVKVRITYMGIESFLWLDDAYRLIKESTPTMGIEMIPISKEEALAEIPPDEAVDIISFFSVKLSKPIPDPRALKFIRLRLSEITSEDLKLGDDYQKLCSEEPLIIETTLPDLEDVPELKLPLNEESEYLKPSVYIQSDHPEIIAQAKKFIGDSKDAKEAVGKLVSGVYHYVKKNPTASMPSALDVLKTREGDCNEHSILFTALARAIGIPSKIYVGLVNLYGDAYYYHAWCAVWLGKWIAVDPTFNQYPADVGHLKLKEGEISEQAKVLKVVGRLKIDVLEYR